MNPSETIITLDTDWAPDWILNEIAHIFIDKKVKSTWFMTNATPVVELLNNHKDLFEIGIHPNFFPNSSHGKNYFQVMENILNIFPNAKSVRTHSLYQSEPLLEMMVENFNIKVDCSQFLKNCANLEPHKLQYRKNGNYLIRVPHFFQDNMNMNDESFWDINNNSYNTKGLKVFNFHPIHIALNSKSQTKYNQLKKSYQLSKITKRDIDNFINEENGTKSLFLNLLRLLSKSKSSLKIFDYAKKWNEKNNNL